MKKWTLLFITNKGKVRGLPLNERAIFYTIVLLSTFVGAFTYVTIEGTRKKALLEEYNRLELKKQEYFERLVKIREDVSVLQENLLDPILGIKNPKEDARIDFVGGIRGLKELERSVDSGKFKVAFSMYPTQMKQLIKISDDGNKMPPKSTWFEPKLKSGLFIHKI